MDLSLDTLCCFHDSTVVHFWHNVTGSSTCAICSSGHYSSAGERSATARKNTRIRYELLITLVTIEARAWACAQAHASTVFPKTGHGQANGSSQIPAWAAKVRGSGPPAIAVHKAPAYLERCLDRKVFPLCAPHFCLRCCFATSEAIFRRNLRTERKTFVSLQVTSSA